MVHFNGRGAKEIIRHFCLASFVLVSACSKEDEKTTTTTTTTTEATYDSLWNNVFADRCGTCHGVTTKSETFGGPDMRTKDSFYANMINKKGTDYPEWDTFQNNRADCLSFSFIAPGLPGKSLLVAVFDPASAPCTVKSHTESPQSIPLSSEDLASLKTWITNGASK
jgi:hypothetical protein